MAIIVLLFLDIDERTSVVVGCAFMLREAAKTNPINISRFFISFRIKQHFFQMYCLINSKLLAQ